MKRLKSSNNFDKFGRFGLREEAMVGQSGKDCKSFCFWHRFDSGNCKFEKVAHRGEASQFGPCYIGSCKRGHTDCQTFLTFLDPNSDCQGYSGHFLGLFWGCVWAAKVNLLTFFGVLPHQCPKTFPKISPRIEEGEEICSNYLDDPETTYCSRSSRQVLPKDKIRI